MRHILAQILGPVLLRRSGYHKFHTGLVLLVVCCIIRIFFGLYETS